MKNKKGFTLIELLAVIVILGLLLLIAVPSITKYINESRKKTLTTTIKSYVSALSLEVNNMKYSFNEQNTIYAVPIECISLERGGTNPFGEWKQVDNTTFAFALVQYNNKKSTYIYGFTFKDNSGHGMYPISQDQIQENGNQIEDEIELEKPTSGFAKSFTAVDNWIGFKVNDYTKLEILNNYTCSFYKPCTSTGTNVGDVVTCYNENFYIMESNSSTTKMLAKYSIDTVKNIQVKTPSSSANNFCDTTNIKDYPAYVYNSGCSIYEYVENYELYLRANGVMSADAKLISHTELEKLGCTIANGSGSCEGTYDWLNSSYGIYWTGSATGTLYPYYGVTTTGSIGSWNPGYPGKVRPVITISTNEINVE